MDDPFDKGCWNILLNMKSMESEESLFFFHLGFAQLKDDVYVDDNPL